MVRDASLTGLVGRYLYADYYTGLIRSLALDFANPDDQSTGCHGRHAVVIRRGRGRPALRREQRRRPGGAADRGQRPRRARYRGPHRLIQPAGRDRHLPRRCQSAVRGRAGGQGQARGERRRAPHAIPGRGALRPLRHRGARAALGGRGARLRLIGEGLRLLHGRRRRHPRGRVHALAAGARGGRSGHAADGAHDRALAGRESQRRPAPLRCRRLPVDQHGRRRRPEQPVQQRPERRHPAREAAAAGSPSPGTARPPCSYPSAPPSADTTAPVLRARVPRRQRVLRLRGAVAYVRCSEACTVSVGGTLRIGRRKLLLRRASGAAQPSPRKRLKVRLRKRSARGCSGARSRTAAARGCTSGCAPATPRATAQPWSVARFACAARRRSRKRRSTGLVASSSARP